jgi:hypothetical protein
MLISITLAVGASLALGLSAPLNAQAPQDKGKDQTKVYAYKKAAPNTQPGMQAPTAPKRANLGQQEIRYGSPEWWREADRYSAGEGGGSE